MLFATVGQGWVFLWMVAAGALIACWYALLAGLRRLLSAGFWLSLAADAAFGVGAAAIFCLALVTGNYGRVRLFPIVGTLVGFALCAAGLFPPVRRAAECFKNMLLHTFVKVRDNCWTNVIFR